MPLLKRLPSIPSPDEESLNPPLSNHHQHHQNNMNPAPPPPSPLKTPLPGLEASPASIREYLASLLISSRGVSDPEAQRIAAAWKVGSGIELRRYGPAMFVEIFGREWGWVLCWEIGLEARSEKLLVVRYPLHSLAFFAVAWQATTISLIATVEMSEGLTIFLIFGAIFGGILLFVCMILQCMGFPSEKKTLERELKRVLTAPVSEQGSGVGEGRGKAE